MTMTNQTSTETRARCTLVVTHHGACHHDPAAPSVWPSPTCGQVVTR